MRIDPQYLLMRVIIVRELFFIKRLLVKLKVLLCYNRKSFAVKKCCLLKAKAANRVSYLILFRFIWIIHSLTNLDILLEYKRV